VDDPIGDLIRSLTELVLGVLPGSGPVRLAGDAAKPSGIRVLETDDERFRSALARAFEDIPGIFATARQQAYDQGWDDVGDSEPAADEDYAEADAAELEEYWRGQHAQLETLLDTEGITADVVAAKAQRIVEREASTQLSAAHSDGLDDAAQASPVDWVFVLVPERDACLRCTSYAGSVCEAGGEFAIVRAFTDKLEPNVSIPVHPWCRCQKRLTHRDDADSVADPLRREAERSVARFESLPSESDRARTEAAKLLLEQGSRLPKTVLERAGRGVRKREKIQAKRATLQKRKRAIERELKTLRTDR
jgi:hypothetical protein